MKKEYSTPIAELIYINTVDIITYSETEGLDPEAPFNDNWI